MAEEIGTIEKANSKMAIKVRVDEYNGKAYADIRNYYLNDDGDYAPTNKGVAFYSVEDLSQAILFLQAAREKLAATLAKKAA